MIENDINLSPMIVDNNNVFFHFSFGIASYPIDGSTLSEMIEIADKRMYQDKRNEDIYEQSLEII